MKRFVTGLAALLFLAVIVQFFLAASDAFDAAPTEEAFGPHRLLGYAVFLFAVVVAVVGAIARLPGRLIGLAALAAGLVLGQVLISELAR